jgi:type I thyroxine 5'-deiodinase
MYAEYGDDVEFCLIYVREAHPNERVMDFFSHDNLQQGINIPRHANESERSAAAQLMCQRLDLEMTTLIDDMENTTGMNYSAFPDRLYLVNREGRIAYKGRHGPEGFEPEELEAAIQTELAANSRAGDRTPPEQPLSKQASSRQILSRQTSSRQTLSSSGAGDPRTVAQGAG